MGTTDSNGIYFYDDTDGAPTPPVLNVGQQSVSNALVGTYRIVADVAARTALVASFSPTTSKPLMVYRLDASFTPKWEWTTDGTTFTPLIEKIYLRIERTTPFQIPSSTLVNLASWDVIETSGITFDNASGRATIPKSGVYRITANMDWQPSAVGNRLLLISQNYQIAGAKNIAADDRLANGGQITSQRTVRDIRFTSGQTVNVLILQTSGAGLGADFSYQPPTLSIEYLGA